MAYRRSTSRRRAASGSRRRTATRSSRARAPSRARRVTRRAGSRTASRGGRQQTVRLVIEHAAPSVATPDGAMYPQVQSTTRKAQF